MPRKRKADASIANVPDSKLAQSPLIPTSVPKTTLKRVPLALIDFEPGQPQPIKPLLANVEHWGVLAPVALGLKSDGRYFVKAGRRRVIAAIEATHKFIDASVTGDDVPAEVVQLGEHALRRENPVGDLLSIERLLERKFADVDAIDAIRDISRNLGLTVGKVENLLKLKKLIPELRQDLAEGHLRRPVAVLICESSLSQAEQMALHDRLQGTGKLTKSDVYKLRHNNDAPPELPGMPQRAEVTPPDMVDAVNIRPPLQTALSYLVALRERFSFAEDAQELLNKAFDMVETAYSLCQPGAVTEADPEPEPVPANEAQAFKDRLSNIADDVRAEQEEAEAAQLTDGAELGDDEDLSETYPEPMTAEVV